MEIKIPKTIKVGGLDYHIRMDKETDVELDARQHYGECATYLKRIRLNSRLDNQQLNVTWYHELVHAVDDVYLGECLDESVIKQMAHGLHQIFDQLGIKFVK